MTGVNKQKCRKCFQEKDISCFGKDKTMKYGYKIYCKDCRKIESKIYTENNHEKIIKYHRNKSTSEKYKKWYKEYNSNPAVRLRIKEYRKSDKNKEIQKRYRKENTSRIFTRKRRRQINKKNLLHPNHDINIEIQMYKDSKFLERKTGYKWNVDHVYPLEYGGPHWHENLQVIPANFNFKKGTKLNYFNDYIKHWTDLSDIVLAWILTREAC